MGAKTNPATKLAQGNIKAIAKDIVENGGIGTNAQRMIEETARAMIEAQWLFNQFGRQLKGTGARMNILTFTTRGGWKELNKNAWREFGFNQAPSFLSENLVVDKAIETSLEWNERDIEDTEKGMENIVSILKNALMEELPVEYEKRFINMWKDVSRNGKDLLSDDVLGNGETYPTAKPYSIEVDITDDTKTKATIDKMIALSVKMSKQENPIIYRPNKSKWMWIINTDLEVAINKAGGFDTFYGDESWERALNNKPFKLLNGIEVLVSNELYDDTPFYFVPKAGAFNNIEAFYTTLPEKFWTKEIPQGESATNRMHKIESSYFSMQASYWAIKMGLVAFGTMGASATTPKDLDAHISSSSTDTGSTAGSYTIDASNTSLTATDFKLVLTNTGNWTEKDFSTSLVIDGTQTFVDLGILPTGSYQLQIRDADGFNLYTSATYYVRNKAETKGTNQETSSTVSTDPQMEALKKENEALKAKLSKEEKKEVKKAEKQEKVKEVKEKAEEIVEKAKEDAKPKA